MKKGENIYRIEENTKQNIVSNIGATENLKYKTVKQKKCIEFRYKISRVRYNTAETGTDVYLNIQFDKEGKNSYRITENTKHKQKEKQQRKHNKEKQQQKIQQQKNNIRKHKSESETTEDKKK